MQREKLIDFTERFIKSGCPIDYSIQSKVYATDVSTSILIYKTGVFAVEQYFMHPGAVVPPHSHPFKSVTVLAMGEMVVKRGETDWFLVPHVGVVNKEVLPAGVEHQFKTGELGAVLYVVTEWDNPDEVNSATIKYVGESMGPIHEALRKTNE